jgi:hypothetical protein
MRQPELVMRRLALSACVMFVAAVGSASATTTVAWNATITEPIGGILQSPFECPSNSNCSSGHGEVIGLGQVQDLVEFGACGSTCDVRTLTFSDASTIVMHEVFSNNQTPGNSDHPTPRSRARYGNPFSGDLDDTTVGGTGRFLGVTGAASGTVKVAGGIATVRLSGLVTF